MSRFGSTLLIAVLLSLALAGQRFAWAQEADEAEAEARAAAALAAPADAPAPAPATTAPAASDPHPQINLLELIVKGGWLGVPIGIMSLVVVAVAIERFLALRRSRIMPSELIAGLGDMAQQQGGFDPRKAYRLCQQYPSTTATVIRTMLLKVGRPHSEVEHAVAETNEREAARLYSHVRTLTMAATVTPLIGLLGTVWGMIQAFFATANMPTGANKAEFLADGIYVALVTTAAGLAVAIPAAVAAHYFEGRIQSLFREIDDLLFSLLPQVERFEGKLRTSRQHLGAEAKPAENGTPEPERQAAQTAQT